MTEKNTDFFQTLLENELGTAESHAAAALLPSREDHYMTWQTCPKSVGGAAGHWCTEQICSSARLPHPELTNDNV
jgi:hypothetical protein